MSKNIYIAVAVVIVLIGGFFLLRGPIANRNMQSDQAADKSSTEVVTEKSVPVDDKTIVYASSGFTPSNIQVKLGEMVTFVNNSSMGMWVASSPHPVHTDYPEFDAKKAYSPGESYTFTFTKAGAWKFHNHLNPSHFGSMTVVQ